MSTIASKITSWRIWCKASRRAFVRGGSIEATKARKRGSDTYRPIKTEEPLRLTHLGRSCPLCASGGGWTRLTSSCALQESRDVVVIGV